MTHKCQKYLVNCSKRSIVRKQQDRWRCSTLDKLPLGVENIMEGWKNEIQKQKENCLFFIMHGNGI